MTDHQRASQRLHYAINKAADEFGRPLPAGQAMFIAQKLMEDLPALVEALANSSQGKAT